MMIYSYSKRSNGDIIADVSMTSPAVATVFVGTLILNLISFLLEHTWMSFFIIMLSPHKLLIKQTALPRMRIVSSSSLIYTSGSYAGFSGLRISLCFSG